MSERATYVAVFLGMGAGFVFIIFAFMIHAKLQQDGILNNPSQLDRVEQRLDDIECMIHKIEEIAEQYGY